MEHSKRPLMWIGLAALMLAALACTCGPLANLSSQVESEMNDAVGTLQVTADVAVPTLAIELGSPDDGEMAGDYDGPIFDGGDGYNTTLAQWYTGPTSGTFSSLLDAHNYVFEAQAGDSVIIEVTGENETDTRVKLIDPEGNVLAEEDDTHDRDPYVVMDSLPASGVYTARVDTWDEGSYEITISLNEEAATDDGQVGGGSVQWGVAAIASTEYGSDSWSANQATGAPDTSPDCGDIATAWASESSTGEDWLEVRFDQAVIPTKVEVYETYNPGAVVLIEVANSQSGYREAIYTATPEAFDEEYCPLVLAINIGGEIVITEPVDTVTVYIDQREHTGWNEIDAVGLYSQ